MSVSSRTPDDKLHRYLQRIEKLVRNRGKSPVSLIKSRNKSPVNVKTPKLDSYLKYELLFKTFLNFTYKYKQSNLLYFIDQLKAYNNE